MKSKLCANYLRPLSVCHSLSLFLSFSHCPFAIRLLINQIIYFNWFDGDLWYFLNLAGNHRNREILTYIYISFIYLYLLMFIYCTNAAYKCTQLRVSILESLYSLSTLSLPFAQLTHSKWPSYLSHTHTHTHNIPKTLRDMSMVLQLVRKLVNFKFAKRNENLAHWHLNGHPNPYLFSLITAQMWFKAR